jgi:hypothetical protein
MALCFIKQGKYLHGMVLSQAQGELYLTYYTERLKTLVLRICSIRGCLLSCVPYRIITNLYTFMYTYIHTYIHTHVYPKVSVLAAWSENCKWYSSMSLGVSLFCESVRWVLLLNECLLLLLLFISLSTQSGNYWIYPRAYKQTYIHILYF